MDQNTKVSDSAYSNSCSNCQSRTSGSSKSRHSNSSGSSGYGRSISNNVPQNLLKSTKDKDRKMKKLKSIIQTQTSTTVDSKEQACTELLEQSSNNEQITSQMENDADQNECQQNLDDPQNTLLSPTLNKITNDDENVTECPEHNNVTMSNDPQEVNTELQQQHQQQQVKSEKSGVEEQGFCCVISMHDGVVLYTTPTITASLGKFHIKKMDFDMLRISSN